MPCPDVVFSAQLVMEDATGGRVKLKHSKRHGQLMLDTGSQSVQLVYPRVGRLFQRKFEQPLKCRLLSEEDTTKCAETLRTFGVEVIAVGESMLSAGRRGLVVQDAAVIAGGEAALQAIRETSPRSMQAEIRDYELSSQLQDDTDAIMRSMFTMNS
ncbi:hypothetical protein F441_01105 [Phytophthora nicotianae CJ01A1]|uniref:Uncharacterized protein n=2 Tax=Phytophthora nicotianae TaxID=4792 RepID=W2JSU9_PHYNI|nr:hypothetical protein L915_01069 [Phytophthora nicotianae]ETL49479.1 hypothetical protein L916_01051 [Phytophthora nicotianae]ETP26085.1 hypothetical protein F441_01105 [Phytophthora nicotianae CJ01A1]